MTDAGPLHQQPDHLARDEERGDRGHRPRDERDDQRAAQRLEVLDDRHALLFDGRGLAWRPLKDPVQEGHEKASALAGLGGVRRLVVEAAGGADGAGASGFASTDALTSLVSSVVAFLNSRIALPTAPPSSGRRPGPKMISTISSSATI